MIERLSGILREKNPDSVVIEVQGIGFFVAMPASAVGALPALGERCTVYTHLNVKEDAMELYGFGDKQSRSLFRLLIGVSGVGPKVALAALSTYTPRELADAIAAQDIARVSHIPGVGKKTAERIILELKGTLERGLETLFDSGAADGVASAASVALAGATEALLSMGFTSAEAEVALKGAPEGAGEGALLQYGLKRLGNR